MSNTLKKQDKQSVSNFLNFPATKKFLEDNLQEKRGEFVSNLIALSEGDSNIAECEPQKLMMCALNATALNLPLNKNLGYAYIVPYKGVPQFQIGFKGWIQLAIRTGKYKILSSVEIREGEIKRNKITQEIEFLGDKEDNPIIGYLAYLELKNGFKASLYMSDKEVEEFASKYSQPYKSDKRNNTKRSLWSDPVERIKMAKKTVLKSLLKSYGIISIEMEKALTNDTDTEQKPNVTDITGIQPVEKPQPDPGSPELVPI